MDSLEYYHKAISFIQAAEEKGIILRVLGSTAIMHHCRENSHLFQNMNRPLTDIDVIAHGKQRAKIEKFFNELGYQSMYHFIGKGRQIYAQGDSSLHIDVFYDQLNFCHPIDFRKRLELDNPTITVSDLLLEKMQIVQINKKDLVDSIILLLEHGLAENDREAVDPAYLSRILGGDWGFYYTFTENLKKLLALLNEFQSILGDEGAERVRNRIMAIQDLVGNCPKTLKWKLRSLIGIRLIWYQEVEDVVREETG